MNEDAWLSSSNPTPMLRFLSPRDDRRRLLLFGIACWRRVLSPRAEPKTIELIELIERVADGKASSEQVSWAQFERIRTEPAEGALNLALDSSDLPINAASYSATDVLCTAASEAGVESLLTLLGLTRDLAAGDWEPAGDSSARFQKQLAQTQLLREIFGNPFRTVPYDPAWRAWQGGKLLSLAKMVYNERGFENVLVLADMLEEAGCTNANILGHCRGDGPHVRGCWVLDLILGKE